MCILLAVILDSHLISAKSRISVRGCITRAARALAELVDEKAGKVELIESIADFDKRMDAIQELVED